MSYVLDTNVVVAPPEGQLGIQPTASVGFLPDQQRSLGAEVSKLEDLQPNAAAPDIVPDSLGPMQTPS
jgi:hypothetical protein